MGDSQACAILTRANLPAWDERATIHARDATGFYGIDRLRAGHDLLLPIEAAEIGDVSGKRLAHLQCHLGIDTLCLARRGANVSGLDFSATAVAAARALAAEIDVPASFVEANVYDAPTVLSSGSFDVVFVSWGSLNWLPDIARWAEVVAALLAPGGYLYLVEQHPFSTAMKEEDGRFFPGYPWRTPPEQPVVTEMPLSYNDDPTPLVNTRLHEWDHPLSEIIGGLLAAGLRLDFLNEHDVLPWRRFSCMVPTADRLYRLPPGTVAMPLSYSLKASKP
jgi:SAM-dependent methyltransferase